MKAPASWLICLLPLAACALPSKPDESSAPKKEESPAAAKKAQDDKKRALETAKMKLEIAKSAQKSDEIEHEAAIVRAKSEREISEREMKQFLEVDMPRRLDESRLRLQETKDGVQDAKEELSQLEDMYKDGDLGDKTREIVLQRGKRRVERSLKWLALQEIDAQSLENVRLPIEKTRVLMALKEKTDALAKAERDAARSKIEKAIAVKDAEAEVAKQEAELAKP